MSQPRPEIVDVITRLERLERRCQILWQTVDVLVDQALDAGTKTLTVDQLRRCRTAAVEEAVAAADRFRAATASSTVMGRPLS